MVSTTEDIVLDKPTAPTLPEPHRPHGPSPRRSPLGWLLLTVVGGAALIAVVVAAFAQDDNTDTVSATQGALEGPVVVEVAADGAVVVEGLALPTLDAGPSDPAVGLQVPEITAPTVDGKERSLVGSNGPVVVVVAAHWCPHCQAELPVILEAFNTDSWPEGVALVVVSSAQDRGRGNWPPSEWLDTVGLSPQQVMVDDDASTAATALGTSAFPYMVGVDSEGILRWRRVGSVPPAELAVLTSSLTGPAAEVSSQD